MKTQTLLLSLGLTTLLATPTSRAATNTVLVGNYFFNPTNLTINVGDTVRWTNTVASTTTHDVTRTNTPFQWASPNLTSANRTFLLTFSNAGTFFYFCDIHVYAALPSNRHPEQTGTVSVIAANLAPSVALTNPADNSSFLAPTDVTLQAVASDADGLITEVQFLSGGNLIGSVLAPPYNFTVSDLVAGNYSFTARAFDNQGASSNSAAVNVIVLTNALLTAPERLAGGQFRFTLQAVVGQTYATEYSSNLTSWSPLATNVAPASSFNITDTTSTNILWRYYRVRQNR